MPLSQLQTLQNGVAALQQQVAVLITQNQLMARELAVSRAVQPANDPILDQVIQQVGAISQSAEISAADAQISDVIGKPPDFQPPQVAGV